MIARRPPWLAYRLSWRAVAPTAERAAAAAPKRAAPKRVAPKPPRARGR